MDSQQPTAAFESLLRALGGGLAAVKAYHPSPLPSPLDEEIRQGLAALRALDPGQRASALARIDGYARGMLASFCARAAMIGARKRDPAWIRDALLALLYTSDPAEPEARRGFFMDLSVIRRAAALAGLDDRALTEALGLAPTPEIAELISIFLKWTPSQRAQLSETVFDGMRRALCLQTRYLDAVEQERAKTTAFQYLNDRWTFNRRRVARARAMAGVDGVQTRS